MKSLFRATQGTPNMFSKFPIASKTNQNGAAGEPHSFFPMEILINDKKLPSNINIFHTIRIPNKLTGYWSQIQ